MDLKVCRLCLMTNVKVISLKTEPLHSYIQYMVSLNIDDDRLPNYTCYKCAANIGKYYRFVKNSINAQSLLYSLLEEDKQITKDSILTINRQELKLNPILSCGPVINFKYPDDEPVSEEPNHSCQFNNIIDTNIVKTENDDILQLGSPCNSFRSESPSLNEELKDSTHFIEQEEKEGSFNKIFVGVKLTDDVSVKLTKQQSTSKTKRNAKEPKLSTSNKKIPNKNRKPAVKPKEKLVKQTKEKVDIIVEEVAATLSKDKRARGRRKSPATEEYFQKYYNIVNLTLEEQIREVERRRQSPWYSNAPFKCDKCYKCFQRSDPFHNHMVEHDPKHGPLECAVCKKRFTSRSVLTRHIVVNHQKQYRCKLCPEVLKERQAQSHISTHEGGVVTFKCPSCSFVTEKRGQYTRHCRSAHGSSHSCARCGRGFASARGLQLHLKRAHRRDQENNEGGEHRCTECDMVFTSEAALLTHTSKHDANKPASNSCSKCGESFDSAQTLRAHCSEKHPADNYYPRKCEHCDVILHGNRESWRHTVRAHPSLKKSYRSVIQSSLCEVCGRGFKSVTDLRMHSLRHAGARSVQCALCPTLFYDAYQLRMHARNVHCATRAHRCPLCDLSFKLKGNLNRHMVVHSGARPYPCPLCGKGFSQSGSRDLHLRTVHHNLPHPPRARRANTTRRH